MSKGRKRMSVNSMKESTKRKYSQSQLQEMKKKEDEIREIFTDNEFEEDIINRIDKKEIQLFNFYKNLLNKLGIYTSVDAITIERILYATKFMRHAIDMRHALIDTGDLDSISKVERSYTLWSNSLDSLYKSLNLSVDMRHHLHQLTSDGELNASNVISEDVMKECLKFLN